MRGRRQLTSRLTQQAAAMRCLLLTLGRILLVDALQQCQRAGQILGVRLMLLDVAPEAGEEARVRLHRFYAAMGFKPLPGHSERLFLSLAALPPLAPGR